MAETPSGGPDRGRRGIALKLIAMDRAKLRKVHNRITNYLKETTGMTKAQREYYANWGRVGWHRATSEKKQWVAEGGSLADYKAGSAT